MPKPIESSPIDLKFCTQVINDITNLFQFPESDSNLFIKNSTFDRTFRKSSIFQLLPKCVELSYGLPNPNPYIRRSTKSPYEAIDIIKIPFRRRFLKSQLSGQLFPFKLLNKNCSFNLFPNLPKIKLDHTRGS